MHSLAPHDVDTQSKPTCTNTFTILSVLVAKKDQVMAFLELWERIVCTMTELDGRAGQQRGK